jgi:hypothetical protein
MAARVERLAWRDIPLDAIDLPKAKLQLTLGLGSGLSASRGRIFAVTDRGPNLFVSQAVEDYGLVELAPLRAIRDAKVMPTPRAGAEIVELSLDGGALRVVRRIPLYTSSGRRLGGAAPAGGEMEQMFDLAGNPLPPDPLGADTEAIAAMPDGSFFLAEEYSPSLLKVSSDGVVSERWVAPGHEPGARHEDVVVRSVLPSPVARRRLNRGLEALCASADGRWLYLGLQSAPVGESEHGTPIWKIDAETGALVGEWLYPFDAPETFRRDAARRKIGPGDLKVCEFAWSGEDRLVVLERIAHSTKLYLVDLARSPAKRLLMSSDDHPEIGSDMEGMAILSPTELLLVSDNDFGVEGAETEFWRITLDAPL